LLAAAPAYRKLAGVVGEVGAGVVEGGGDAAAAGEAGVEAAEQIAGGDGQHRVAHGEHRRDAGGEEPAGHAA
jgi:hypothetical protein